MQAQDKSSCQLSNFPVQTTTQVTVVLSNPALTQQQVKGTLSVLLFHLEETLCPSTLPIFNSNDSLTMSLRFIDMQGCRGSHYYTELIGPPFFCFLSNPSPSPPCFVSSLPYIVFGLWFISKPDYWAEDQSSKYVSKADMSIVVYFVPKCPSL